MPLEETLEFWCRLFGYGSCFYVPPEMAAVLALAAALTACAVIAVLFGFIQKLTG